MVIIRLILDGLMKIIVQIKLIFFLMFILDYHSDCWFANYSNLYYRVLISQIKNLLLQKPHLFIPNFPKYFPLYCFDFFNLAQFPLFKKFFLPMFKSFASHQKNYSKQSFHHPTGWTN